MIMFLNNIVKIQVGGFAGRVEAIVEYRERTMDYINI